MPLAFNDVVPTSEGLISGAKNHLTMDLLIRIRAHGIIASWPEQDPSSTNSIAINAMSLLDHVFIHSR